MTTTRVLNQFLSHNTTKSPNSRQRRNSHTPPPTSEFRTTCRMMNLIVAIGITIRFGTGAGTILVSIASSSNTGGSNHKISRIEKLPP